MDAAHFSFLLFLFFPRFVLCLFVVLRDGCVLRRAGGDEKLGQVDASGLVGKVSLKKDAGSFDVELLGA